jgi:hypothetical protein
MTKSTPDSVPARVQLYLRAWSRPQTQKCQCLFATIMPIGAYTLTQSRGAGRYHTGTSYCVCSSSRLGSRGSVKGTTQRPGHMAHSGRSRDRIAIRMQCISDCSPKYKSYMDQWKSLAVRNGIPECHRESADRRSKIAQKVLPQSRVNDVLSELHGGPSGGHYGVNKSLNWVRQKYY